MPLSRACKLFFAVVLFIPINQVCAQQHTDTILYSQAIASLLNRFDAGVKQSGRIYNGYIYQNYDSSIGGSPFLDDNNHFSNGDVDYDGEVFQNVPLLLDINADQLIAMPDNSTDAYVLIQDKVKSFTVHTRRFVLIKNGQLKTGYYEQLYGGRSEVINKIQKTLKTTFNAAGTQRFFVPVNDYQQFYIKIQGIYRSVSSLNDILDVFADRKKELKQFIKSNNIRFNALKEYSLAQIAKYYDQLTQ